MKNEQTPRQLSESTFWYGGDAAPDLYLGRPRKVAPEPSLFWPIAKYIGCIALALAMLWFIATWVAL